MKIKRFTITVMVLVILLSFNSLAFAVTSYYGAGNPLILNPGESQLVQAFGLQNMVGNQDMTIRVEQASGFEIAEILDSSLDYKVPYGRKDVYINMKVTVPEDAKIGDIYSIGANFRSLVTGEGGNVQLTAGIGNSIVVVVGERVEETEKIAEEVPIKEKPSAISETIKKRYSGIGVLISILILAIIIMLYRYESKKNKKSKKKNQ